MLFSLLLRCYSTVAHGRRASSLRQDRAPRLSCPDGRAGLKACDYGTHGASQMQTELVKSVTDLGSLALDLLEGLL
jgi:hypothetical protein